MGQPARKLQDATLEELAEAIARALSGPASRPLGPDDWLSTADLADRTGRHAETVRRWIQQRGLPAKRIPGGGYLVRYGDFIAWDADGGGDHAAAIDAVLRTVS